MHIKFILLLFLVSSSFLSFGQPESGQVLLTGGVSFVKAGDFKPFSFQLNGGYFTSNLNALGVITSFSKQSDYDPFNDISIEQTDFNIGLFNKKYFKFGEEGNFFASLTSSFQYFKSTSEYSGIFSGKSVAEGFVVSVSPGFTFFPTRKVGLDISLIGLNYSKIKDADEGGFVADMDLTSPTLGVSFLIGK